MLEFLQNIADLFDPFSSIAKYAGLGGLTIGLVFLIFKEILRKAIFPTLTKVQGYNIIRLIIVCCTAVAVIGLAVYTVSTTAKQNHSREFAQSDSLRYEPLILQKDAEILIDSNNKK